MLISGIILRIHFLLQIKVLNHKLEEYRIEHKKEDEALEDEIAAMEDRLAEVKSDLESVRSQLETMAIRVSGHRTLLYLLLYSVSYDLFDYRIFKAGTI